MFRSYGSINSRRTCEDVLKILTNDCRADQMDVCRNRVPSMNAQDQIEIASFSEFSSNQNEKLRDASTAIARKPGCRLGLKRVITKSFDDEPPQKRDRDENLVPLPGGTRCFRVLYAKPQLKKHKTWEEDGYLILSNCVFTLKNLEGRTIAKAGFVDQRLFEGHQFALGDKMVQIDEELFENAPRLVIDRL